ncbi:MAG: hypothetical protein HC788_03635 [Sphingopyxis sp.]|nr:hypothetical protein [Sphingopyxis sp.]
MLMACILAALWEIGMKSWRLIRPQAALAVQNGQLLLHPSFVNAPPAIALAAIRAVTFDRADRASPTGMDSALTAYSLTNRLAMKFGARLRHILLINYIDERGHNENVRINDAEVDGGVDQLRRFADYLRMIAKPSQVR